MSDVITLADIIKARDHLKSKTIQPKSYLFRCPHVNGTTTKGIAVVYGIELCKICNDDINKKINDGIISGE